MGSEMPPKGKGSANGAGTEKYSAVDSLEEVLVDMASGPLKAPRASHSSKG